MEWSKHPAWKESDQPYCLGLVHYSKVQREIDYLIHKYIQELVLIIVLIVV